MPATSVSAVWVNAIAFDTSRPAPRRTSKRPPVRTSAPERRTPKAKPAPKAKRCRATRLSPQCCAVFVDRMERAVDCGIFDLAPDTEPVDSICLTMGEYALLMRLLSPEEYVRPERPVRKPTATAPGSEDRIEAYRQRAARGEQLYHDDDATAHRAHERGLRIEQRGNGTGVRVLGWADEGEG